MNSLWLDTFNGWVSNFFISMAGFRYPRYWASQTMIWDGENRWTSTCQSWWSPYSVIVLWQSALTIQIDYSYNASFWACVRPFYNGYVEPTASWTVLNGTLWWPWIFHNATDWIISLNDWTNYITMADKNLWATTVYNSWDTRSQTNCWNTYQWWNNYWFSYSSTVSTSNTKVDASNYWPWNYYSSSTFIQTTTSENDWSNPSNTNLWWWDVWIVTINNAITNIGVISVNWQTWHVTVESWWYQSFFKTQDEYDALPESKESDWNLYIIVDRHSLMEYEELVQLNSSAIVDELNSTPIGYCEKFNNKWHLYISSWWPCLSDDGEHERRFDNCVIYVYQNSQNHYTWTLGCPGV